MICSSVNRDRFIVHPLQGDGLYSFLAELQGLRSHRRNSSQRFGGRSHISISPKIAGAIQSITPVLPDGSSVYLFGSASRSDRYADVDLLILYDPTLCPAARAHADHQAFVDTVAEMAGAPVHVCLLSYREERTNGFIGQVAAIPLIIGLENW